MREYQRALIKSLLKPGDAVFRRALTVQNRLTFELVVREKTASQKQYNSRNKSQSIWESLRMLL